MSKNIAFIGLGNMGSPMAKNLIKQGHQLTVYDLNQQAMDELQQLGAKTASQAVDAVSQAEIVISMLPNGAIVKSLYKQLIPELSANTLVIDSSTIAADDARTVAKMCAEQNIAMIDAPVSGGTAAAQAATLTFICGGKQEHYQQAEPILQAMGKNIFHAGESGAGQVAKICNNMLLAIHMIGTAEAINMAKQQGLDPKVTSEIMKASSGNNWSLQVYNPYPQVMENVPASNNYQGGFMVDLMNKDLGLAQQLAASAQTATPLGAMAAQLYQIHQVSGHGKEDFSGIIKLLQKQNGS